MFTLKQIKYHSGLSHETHAYTASLYLNGKRVGNVSNAGHGGCDDVYYTDENARKAVNEALAGMAPPRRTDAEKAALIRSRIIKMWEIGDSAYDPSMNSFPDEVLLRDHSDLLEKDWFDPTLESICCDLVNQWLLEQEVKKLTSKRVIWTKKGQKGIYQTQCASKAATRDRWATEIAAEPDTDVVLNHLPLAEAVEVFGRAIV